MAGIIIPLFGKRTFDFSNLGASGTAEYVMVKALDLSQWTDVSLWIRVHSNGTEAGGEIQVIAHPTAPSVEDPAVDFVATGTSVSYTIDESTPSPGLLGVGMSAVSSPAVQISVKGVQNSGPPLVAIVAELSVEIVAKAKN